MARELVIYLSTAAFLSINCPLVLVNLIANISYACCLIFPPSNKQKFKQPLKTLLGYIVSCSIIYFLSLTVMYAVIQARESFEVFVVSWMISSFYVQTSMACSVWLNFYYYIQIVPSQRALLIWVKRNIRSVIYIALLSEGMFFFFSGVLTVAMTIFNTSSVLNGTWIEHRTDELLFTNLVFSFILKAHVFGCLCLMTFCSISIVHYLHRHIQSIAKGGSYLSHPKIQSQIRVAITGVSQGMLFFLTGTYFFFGSFICMFSPYISISGWISFTISSLYLSGTTVNLGVCQTAFRQRVANVLKALKALCGARMVKKDVKKGLTAHTAAAGAQMSS